MRTFFITLLLVIVSLSPVFSQPKYEIRATWITTLGGMDFLGNILAVHLVQDILERGDVVVIPQGVDTVIHGDIADTVSWEKVLNQMPCLQIVTPQSAEVFLCQVGTKKFLRFYKPFIGG